MVFPISSVYSINYFIGEGVARTRAVVGKQARAGERRRPESHIKSRPYGDTGGRFQTVNTLAVASMHQSADTGVLETGGASSRLALVPQQGCVTALGSLVRGLESKHT